MVHLLPVFYPGATHLYDLYCFSHLFNYPNIYSISSYFGSSCEYWYIPECACFGVVVYSGFGVVGEYHGGTLSISSRSSRSSKSRILRAPLCLATHYVWGSALHPAITCAILSGNTWHIRHIASLVVSVPVLFWLYNFVGTSCWYSSNSPAMVFGGTICHLYKQLKQSTRSVSIHRVYIKFPCHFWSLIVFHPLGIHIVLHYFSDLLT